MPGAPRGRATYEIITHSTNEGCLVRLQFIWIITISQNRVFALSLLTKELNVICLWLKIPASTYSHYTRPGGIFRKG